MVLRIQVNVSDKQLENALWFTMRRHTPGLRVLPFTLLLALVAPFVIFTLARQGLALPPSAYLFSIACFGYAFAVPLGLRHIAARGAKRREETQFFEFDDKGFVVSTSHQRSKLEWSKLYEAVRSRDLFLLYEKPSVFHVVPATGEDAEALAALLKQHIPRKRQALDLLSWLSPGTIALITLVAVGCFFFLQDTP